MRNVDEMFPELARYVFIDIVLGREFQCDRQHVQTVGRHPARPIRLLDRAARRKRSASIEHADVVETEKSTLKDILPVEILAVHPPGEIQQQLLKHTRQEIAI